MTGLTLAQIEAAFDDWSGERTRLSERASAYRRGRDMLAAVSDVARREAVARASAAALARGVDNDGRWKLRRVVVPDITRPRLTAQAVRRWEPSLWTDARVPTWRLSITADPAVCKPYRAVPIKDGTVGALIATMRFDTARRTEANQAIDVARPALIDVFEAVSAVSVWCGEPLRSTDGWTVGYNLADVFSARACAELCAARSIELAPMLVDVTVRGGVRWRVVDRDGDDDADGYDDGDTYAE